MTRRVLDAYRIAHAAGWDEGNRSARRAGRDRWTADDWNAATRAFRDALGALARHAGALAPRTVIVRRATEGRP